MICCLQNPARSQIMSAKDRYVYMSHNCYLTRKSLLIESRLLHAHIQALLSAARLAGLQNIVE